MRWLKRMSGLCLSLCLALSISVSARAAEKESYSYTVRFLSGAQGEFDAGGNLSNNGTQTPRMESSECLVFEDLKPGQRVNFNNGMIRLKDNGKYYVKGIRESGKDNNTVYYLSFTVEGDKDYVVAYGILGDAVAYTIHYEDAAGNRLAPSETYYGNVGDRPVVSYLYIEGYQPQAYNLIGRLGENAADNVFTFVYTRARTADTTGTATTNPGTADAGSAAGSAGAGTTTGGGAAEGNVTGAGSTGAGTGPAAGGAAGAAGAAAAGGAAEDTDVGGAGAEEIPDIVSADDEDVPLANGSDVAGGGASAGMSALAGKKVPTEFAKLLGVPVSAKVGIISVLILLAGSAIRFIVLRGRKKEEHE